MTKESYQERVVSSLRELSQDRLKVVLDFVEYLRSREEWEATADILGDEKTVSAIRAAESDWQAGRKEKFVPGDRAKRRV